MTVFGPFYPSTLQSVVNHAETLSELLAVHELAPPTDEWARAWIIGRSDEVARFAEHVVGLWRHGRRTPAAAAAMLEGYLASVHEGLERQLGCKAPSCCLTPQADTTPGFRRSAMRGPAANHVVVGGDATVMGALDELVLEE